MNNNTAKSIELIVTTMISLQADAREMQADDFRLLQACRICSDRPSSENRAVLSSKAGIGEILLRNYRRKFTLARKYSDALYNLPPSCAEWRAETMATLGRVVNDFERRLCSFENAIASGRFVLGD